MASNIYCQQDKLMYILDHVLELAFVAVELCAIVMLSFNYGRINKKRDALLQSGELKKMDMSDMGDRAPNV